MKKIIPILLVTGMCGMTSVAFAQQYDNNGPKTRAEVKSELVQVERAGYNPGTRDPYYPSSIQGAENRVWGGSDSYSHH